MRRWKSARARRVLAALRKRGWEIKRQSGSHRVLCEGRLPDYVFAFHDKEEIGTRMLASSCSTHRSSAVRGSYPAPLMPGPSPMPQ